MQQTLTKRKQIFNDAIARPVGTKNPVLYRTYSRYTPSGRESWDAIVDRAMLGLARLGGLSSEAVSWLDELVRSEVVMPSGRWLWCGGSAWLERPANYYGGYNCSSVNVVDWKSFGTMMSLSMMGSGTGAVLQNRYISKLPPIRNRIELRLVGEIGTVPKDERYEMTSVDIKGNNVTIVVGDSRGGWVSSYQSILELSSDPQFDSNNPLVISVDLSHVRPEGEPLQGFGGVANPVKLPEMYPRIVRILNVAVGRQLFAIECCLLIDEAAITVVAGAIRRSAGMREFDKKEPRHKENLWIHNPETGSWSIDPERDALRMANHTRLWATKPTLEECIDAVESQIRCGEGAIMWTGQALARANRDLLPDSTTSNFFISLYNQNPLVAGDFLQSRFQETYHCPISNFELEHRLSRVGLNPCLGAGTLVRVWKSPDGEKAPSLTDPSELQMIVSLYTAQNLVSNPPRYWVRDSNGELVEVKFAETRKNARMVEVTYRVEGKNSFLNVTDDHEFWIYPEAAGDNPIEPVRCKVTDLQAHPEYGDRLMGASGQPMCRVIKVEHLDGEWPAYSCVVPTTHSFDLQFICTPNCGR